MPPDLGVSAATEETARAVHTAMAAGPIHRTIFMPVSRAPAVPGPGDLVRDDGLARSSARSERVSYRIGRRSYHGAARDRRRVPQPRHPSRAPRLLLVGRVRRDPCWD